VAQKNGGQARGDGAVDQHPRMAAAPRSHPGLQRSPARHAVGPPAPTGSRAWEKLPLDINPAIVGDPNSQRVVGSPELASRGSSNWGGVAQLVQATRRRQLEGLGQRQAVNGSLHRSSASR